MPNYIGLMGYNAVNIIRQADLEFTINELSNSEQDGKKFVDWAKKHVLDTLDYHASDQTKDDTIVQIPELKVELHLDVGKDLFGDSQGWISHINEQILHALKQSLVKNQITGISLAQYKANNVLSFIRNGFLEFHETTENWDDKVTVFLKELLDNETLQLEWLKAIRDKDAFIRFFKLRTRQEIDEWIEKWTGEKKISIRLADTLKFIESNPDHFISINEIEFYYKIFINLPTSRMSARRTVLSVIKQSLRRKKIALKELIVTDDVSTELKELLQSDELSKIPEKPETKIMESETNVPEISDTGAYVGQAGLVLLAPFLPEFLQILGYIGKKGRLDKQLQLPILLHYLATGESEAHEWDLSLPKVLAGLALGQHCETILKATKKIDAEINKLLSSVIAYWERLKKTSPEALRDTFLIRRGELKFKNGYYFLYVEEQTVDILMSFIPWNYSTIKFNWMLDILFVEWRKQ